MDEKTIKRVVAIGDELVALDRKRNEIEAETKRLLSEAHRITRPRGILDIQGDDETVLPKPSLRTTARLIRNQVPTKASRTLELLMRTERQTKHQVAAALGITAMQAHYCLMGLRQRGQVERVAQGVWALTEAGKEECLKRFPAADLVVESEVAR